MMGKCKSCEQMGDLEPDTNLCRDCFFEDEREEAYTEEQWQ